MSNLESIRQWVESGKQIGRKISYSKEGAIHWLAIGVQKWNDVYKVHIDEIREEDMVDENYLNDFTVCVQTFDEVVSKIEEQALISILDLAPCKGQKIFNPAFE